MQLAKFVKTLLNPLLGLDFYFADVQFLRGHFRKK